MSSASNRKAFGRDFGLVHEAVVTTRKADWEETEWAMLAHNPDLAVLFRSVMLGDAAVVPVVREIDGDCMPELSAGDGVNPEVVRHTPIGVHKWSDLSFELLRPKIEKYLSRRKAKLQRDSLAFNKEEQLPRYLVGQLLGNKNLRDYFLRNQHLIPKEWKGLTWHLSGSTSQILFWGTNLREGYDSNRELVVPGMWNNGERWVACNRNLETAAAWHDFFAVIVSPMA